MTQPKETPNTVFTLTLPTPEGGGIAPERATATLLIQRGDLAHVRQFHYNGQLADLITAIREATIELGLLEDHPPIIPETPKARPKQKRNRSPRLRKPHPRRLSKKNRPSTFRSRKEQRRSRSAT